MITKKIFYSIVFAGFILSSCQKDLDTFVPDPGQAITGDTTWYNNITGAMPVVTLQNNLLIDVQQDSFQLNPGALAVTTTGTGLQCTFNPASLVNSSNIPVSGKVYIETYLLKKKGDLLRMAKPTTSNGRMLVSGGAFFMNLSKNGEAVQIAQGTHIKVKYDDSPTSGLMGVFNGTQTVAGSFDWLPNIDSTNNNVAAYSQYYEVLTSELNWINCDQFYDTAGIDRIVVTAVLPANYTNANSIAYTVFDDMRSVIGMYGNETTRKFSTGKLPVNKPITVIVISKQGDDYYLGHQQAMTLYGAIGSQPVNIIPVKRSLAEILAYLNSL